MRFTSIQLDDFKSVLKAEKGWTTIEEPNTKEHVFEFPLSSRPHIVVRVCSSIRKNDDNCRSKGADAIRVFAINKIQNRGWISTTRVLRVEGWKNNLTNAVTKTFSAAQARF